MTPIAPHITAFFEHRLPIERGVSDNTRDSYAYTFRLLLKYASDRLKVAPSQLQLEQIDAPLVRDFLDHLQGVRGNGASSRKYPPGGYQVLYAFFGIPSPFCSGAGSADYRYPNQKNRVSSG
jgi:integrase/recombinase XerD